MKDSNLAKMSHQELWDLHERISSILCDRLEEAKQKREYQLDQLRRDRLGLPRRPARKHHATAEYRNPARPEQTWSGRGKPPRWIAKLLASGRSLDDYSVGRRELNQD